MPGELYPDSPWNSRASSQHGSGDEYEHYAYTHVDASPSLLDRSGDEPISEMPARRVRHPLDDEPLSDMPAPRFRYPELNTQAPKTSKRPHGSWAKSAGKKPAQDVVSWSKEPDISIEALPLAQVIGNPHVSELLNKVMRFSEVATRQQETIKWQSDEIAALKRENQNLRSNSFRSTQGSRRSTSSALSIDLASQVNGSHTNNPSAWPLHQRVENPSAVPPLGMDRKLVIWSIEDARESPLVGMTKANFSRPPMQKAIRHPDGTQLTPSEYRTILGLGKEVIRDLLLPLPEPLNWDRKRKTKTYYISHHASAFAKAVQALEQKEILLSYCTGSWKAEHVLMSIFHGDEVEGDSQVGRVVLDPAVVSNQPQAKPKSKRKRSGTDGKGAAKRRDRRGSNQCDEQAPPPTGSPSQTQTHTSAAPESPTTTGRRATLIHNQITQHGGIELGAGEQQAPATDPPQTAAKVPEIPASPQMVFGTDIAFVDVGFIDIRETVEHIRVDTAATPPPASNVVAYLKRLQDASPNDPSLSEEDNTINFGHSHHAGGGLTITGAITSWESVGSVGTARLLLAAAIRIFKIARHVVFHRKAPAQTSALLAEVYLGLLIERLWSIWSEAHPKSIAPAAVATGSPKPTSSLDDDANIEKQLMTILKGPLLVYAKKHKISVVDVATGKEINKGPLVAAILKGHSPSADDITFMKGSASTIPKKGRKANESG
ncbi:hypothetical protein BKA70DRAFT_1525331 [Coprinopsis sp. MPI-PUGE-AT-0042]|nr:hypothetical protein BKA70DRAFT_1525331 [Coprinopsis sp. MPI-PUGE-AT-0042]